MKFPKFTFLFVLLVNIVAVMFVMTDGTFVIKTSQPRTLPYIFESMWDGFVEGRVDIPKKAALWEAFYINGRYYVYYGFFPAFLRFLYLTILGDDWYGKLYILSNSIATVIISIFTFLIVFEGIRYCSFKLNFLKKIFLAVFSISFVIGSPILATVVRNGVWDELVMWGYAFNLMGVYSFIKFLDKQESDFAILFLSIAASLAFITRATFGGPLYLLVAIALFSLIHQRKLTLKKMWFFSICIWGLNFQLWYNYVRFGSIFTFVPTDSGPFYNEVMRHGGIVNILRIKENFFYYFIPSFSDGTIRSIFPYFYSIHHPWKDDSIFTPYYCFIIPITIIMPYFVFFSFSAIYLFFKNLFLRRKEMVLKMLAIVVPLVIECMMILGFNACFERYKIEFMPLLLVCAFFSFRGIKSRSFITIVGILCLYSCVSTFLHSISFRPVVM